MPHSYTKKTSLSLHVIFIVSWIVFRSYFALRYRVRVRFSRKILKAPMPFIIASNHRGVSDPWILGAVLPFRLFRHIAPFAVVATQSFNSAALTRLYRLRIIPFIYKLYDAALLPHAKKGVEISINKKLQGAIERFRQGRNILIFPEGHIVEKGGVDEFYRGVLFLHWELGASIVPVAVRKDIENMRRGLRVAWGEPLEFKKGEWKELDALQSLRDRVSYLYQETANKSHRD